VRLDRGAIGEPGKNGRWSDPAARPCRGSAQAWPLSYAGGSD
jgi:hypothetical protein